MSGKTLLIDGDLLLYKFACRNEETIEWEPEVVSSFTNLMIAKEEVSEFYPKLLKATDCVSGLICFSCPKEENFRYKVLPSYKHNRQGKEKPKLYYDLKQYLIDNYETKTKSTLEADDILGIMATKFPDRYVIASYDKDLKQIPGEHYNWMTEEYTEIAKEEADYWFYLQILIGDATDGYSGCPGIGMKRAKKILDGTYSMVNLELTPKDFEKLQWSNIVDTYVSKGLTEEDALQQARVAKILRKEDWNFKKGEVILWDI